VLEKLQFVNILEEGKNILLKLIEMFVSKKTIQSLPSKI
jgi:hypothetical protein